jgi:sodium-independent sulfate anion transporter 11
VQKEPSICVSSKLRINCDVTTERDLVPGFVTLIACLALGVELGIVIGVAVDIGFLLYFNARPGIQVERIQVGVSTTLYVLTMHRL